jgi:hypothetical protein
MVARERLARVDGGAISAIAGFTFRLKFGTDAALT